MNLRLTARRQRAAARFTILPLMAWLVDRGYVRPGTEESLGAILASTKYESEYRAYVKRKTAEREKLVWHDHFKFLTETAKCKQMAGAA